MFIWCFVGFMDILEENFADVIKNFVNLMKIDEKIGRS